MKHNKCYTISVIAGVLILLVFSIAYVVIVDPFFQYHKPLERLNYEVNNQAFQNPGLAKSFEYDALITGSSMTENFRTEYFKEENVIKLPYSGAFPQNGNAIISCAAENNPELNKVYWCLDSFNYTRDPELFGQEYAEYLYDRNYFNDVNYVLNQDVILKRIPQILLDSSNGSREINLSEMYCWETSYIFSENATLIHYENLEKPVSDLDSHDEARKNANANISQWVIPIIEKYPQIEFNLYFPPYSILYWNVSEEDVNTTIGIEKEIISQLLGYPNVRIFYFQNQEEIVGNLYNYKDYIHHSEKINKYIAEAMQNGECELTLDNYEEELEKMEIIVHNYDYSIFEQEGNLRGINDLSLYLEKLHEDNRVIIAVIQPDVKCELEDEMLKIGISSGFFDGENAMVNIIDTGVLVAEKSNMSMVQCSYENLDIRINLDKNESGIWIDGTNYATNLNMINFVIYDKDLERVIDSVEIDCNDSLIVRK